MDTNKPRIVISAVNLTEMGTLTILRDCLTYAARELAAKYEIIALVNSKCLVDLPNIRYYEFPNIKRSWLKRVYYEYFGFKKLSKELNAFLWFSLHDMSANVVAERRAVYFQNPSPFYSLKLTEFHIEPKFTLFNLFYLYLYRVNIRSNNFVVVQQDWLRRELKRHFGTLNVVVANPALIPSEKRCSGRGPNSPNPTTTFLFPAYPRIHKNVEVIGRAVEVLLRRGVANFIVYLTLDGSENRYAKRIVARFAHLNQIKFLGLLRREQVFEHYEKTDCLIFPSKLETWGLPITEFKQFGKPMIVASSQYTPETVGDYGRAVFFDPDDAEQLANQMQRAIENRLEFPKRPPLAIDPPFARGWDGLFSILLK